jgi:DNA-binding transcriptional LysR family regulator
VKSFDAIVRRVNLRELRILLAVARAGSLLKAAGEIGLTQPAVSKSIADLEATLGVRLFDRNNRGVQATPQGAIVIRRALAMFEEMRQAVRELGFMEDASSGEVRIGGTPSVCGGLLAHAVAQLQTRRPGVRHDVVELESEQLLAEVRGRLVDVGVGRKPVLRADDEIAFEPLFDDRLFVVCGARHAQARRGTVALGDLAAERWVFPSPGSFVTRQLEAAFERARVTPPAPAVATMSTLLRYELLASQRFITVLHGSLLQFGRLPGNLRVLPVDLGAAVPIGLFRARQRTLSPATEMLIETLHKLAGPMQAVNAQQLRKLLRGRTGK